MHVAPDDLVATGGFIALDRSVDLGDAEVDRRLGVVREDLAPNGVPWRFGMRALPCRAP